MEEAAEAVLASHPLHKGHHKHIVVHSEIGFLENRSKLELVWSHLVVTCLTRNAKFKSLDFNVLHKLFNTFRYASEIMVVHLLVLG